MNQRWLRAVLLTALVAGWSGCTFDADYHRTRYRCEDGACPSGYTCRSGRCEPVTGGVTPGEVKGCGTTNLLGYDFEGESLDNIDWYSWGNLDVVQAEGRLQITSTDENTYRFGGYETRQLYLLRGSRAFVEVPDYDPATGGALALVLETEAVNQASFELEGTELRARYALVNDEHTIATLEHDPEAHRFWQIREQDGTLYWETSADAEGWEIMASTASLPFGDLVRVKLVAGLPAGAGPVFFDNVNGGAAAADESWCAADTIRDDFEDGIVGAVWSSWASESCRSFEKDGALVFQYEPEGDGECGYATITRYDLTGSSVSVEVPKVDETGLIRTELVLDFLDDNWISLEHGNVSDEETNRLVCRNHIGGANATPCSLVYDSEQHRWWRFRHEAAENVVHWETSPDGAEWTSHGKYDAGSFALTGALVVLYTSSYGVEGREDAGNRFDNLNIAGD